MKSKARSRKLVPQNVHSLVHFVEAERLKQNLKICDLATRSGYNEAVMSGWKRGMAIKVPAAEAVLQVLGFKLVVQRIEKNK